MSDLVVVSLFLLILTPALVYLYVDTYGVALPWVRLARPRRSSPTSPPLPPQRGAAVTGSLPQYTPPSPLIAVLPPLQTAVAPQPRAQHIPEIVHTSRAPVSVSPRGIISSIRGSLFALSEDAWSRRSREGYELQTWGTTMHLAEEAQRVRHRMEVAEIAHWGELEAARAHLIDDERDRQEAAADHAQQRMEMLDDHARRRPQQLDDEARTRAEALADHARTRAHMLEDDQLTRPWLVAAKRFQLEVQSHEQTTTRETWSDAAATRAQAQADSTRTRADALEDARRSRIQSVAGQDFAAEHAERQRLELRRAWADADEDRPQLREAAKQQQRYALEEALHKRRQIQAETAARRIDAARTRRLVRAQDARDEARALREQQLDSAKVELAIEEHRRELQERRKPPVRDLAREALTRDCERVALDVSTGTVLVDPANLYHGFAALKYHEARKTLDPDAALASTIAALVRRRASQREITEAEARAFLEQYERVCDADGTREGFQNAKTVLEQFGIGTEDDYANE